MHLQQTPTASGPNNRQTTESVNGSPFAAKMGIECRNSIGGPELWETKKESSSRATERRPPPPVSCCDVLCCAVSRCLRRYRQNKTAIPDPVFAAAAPKNSDFVGAKTPKTAPGAKK
mmetsp:Transcript_19312/g.39729  ORF Transcript_19312/g.39729 Transcript_19312/m.39729 type:complete len:117 (-) Transcript_19312:632-982(-)